MMVGEVIKGLKSAFLKAPPESWMWKLVRLNRNDATEELGKVESSTGCKDFDPNHCLRKPVCPWQKKIPVDA